MDRAEQFQKECLKCYNLVKLIFIDLRDKLI